MRHSDHGRFHASIYNYVNLIRFYDLCLPPPMTLEQPVGKSLALPVDQRLDQPVGVGLVKVEDSE